MSIALHGICAAKGIAIGRIYIVDRGQLEVTEYLLAPREVEAEVARFLGALEVAREQLRAVREHIPAGVTADIAAFLDSHLLMLEDSALTRVPVELVRQRRCNAEWALKLQRDTLISVFEEIEDPYLRTRKDDVDHVVTRIQRILLAQERPRHETSDSLLAGSIVLAHDLTAADVVLLHQQGIAGFITEYGGPLSHTAILARSLRIPAVVGLHQARAYLRDEELVVIDGRAGVVLVRPDPRTIHFYEARQSDITRHHALRMQLRDAPAVTRDGVHVALYANIELPVDLQVVLSANAAGVGLYRTEFLFMNRGVLPDEEEQLAAYRQVVETLGPAPVTIRTLDLAVDKAALAVAREGSLATNPALGLRAVRLCLRDPALFRPQIRAILRSSAHGNVRLMVPMLSNLSELSQILALVEECRRALRREGLAFDPRMPVGAMVEVPAVAICADLFAARLDFLSIGTNDLIQYTMAVDRGDDEVNYLYDPLHPAVLRLIETTIRAGRRFRKSVSMCGEMAGNPHYTHLLLGLGLREFSVPPNALLEIKQVMSASDVSYLEPLTRKLMRTGDSALRMELLERIGLGGERAA